MDPKNMKRIIILIVLEAKLNIRKQKKQKPKLKMMNYLLCNKWFKKNCLKNNSYKSKKKM